MSPQVACQVGLIVGAANNLVAGDYITAAISTWAIRVVGDRAETACEEP